MKTEDRSRIFIKDFRRGLASTLDSLAWHKVISIQRGGPTPDIAETRGVLVHPDRWEEIQRELTELRRENALLRGQDNTRRAA